MPKATLEYNLPEERDDHILAINGSKYHSALEDVRNEFRTYLKYKELTDVEYKLIEEFQQKFFEITEGCWYD